MSQLSLTLLRLGFLALLWGLVLTAIAVLRADIYGTRILKRGRGLPGRRGQTKPLAAQPPVRASLGVKSSPSRSDRTPYLAVIAGPLKGMTIPLGTAPVTIGRAPTSTLVLEDDYCSVRHARLAREDDHWELEDLGSTNGTYLGDSRVDEPITIVVGDVIRLGATSIEMKD